MKINSSIRAIYQEVRELHKLLEARVKEAFEGGKRKQWFFLCRIKEEESFALKLETGRVSDPRTMEDFFACTLVVENRSSISEALNIVEDICDIVSRRPPDEGKTHKSPDEFCFDDLRLYVKLKASDQLPPTPLNDIIFEIQIKTFLQHAWSIATHDLVYKGQNVDWGRARVAYQIKAMLEHAEISVERVDAMAESSLLAVTDEKIRKLKAVIDWLRSTWDGEWLPKDMVRLAENIIAMCQAINVDLDDTIECVRLDTEAGQGASLHDLTPFAVVLRSLYGHHRDRLEKYLRAEKGRFRIFFADDPELSQKITSLPGARPEKFVFIKQPEESI